MKPVIEIRGLTRVYDLGDVKVHALRGINLTVNQGEFLAIMGASGSGKSTLLNVIGCLDRPTTGRYLLDGEETSRLSRNQYSDVRNRKIGFIFQGYNLIARTSALENVELPLLYDRSGHHGPAGQLASAALARVGLGDRMHHVPNQLSGGQQQRVAIARALVTGPKLLLCDEPTGALDLDTGRTVLALLQRTAREDHRCVVIVTHNQGIAVMADRVLRVHDGSIADETVQEAGSAQDVNW
jgi:putative ABC transport system ATP-binding protein